MAAGVTRIYIGDPLYYFLNDDRAKFGSINGPNAGPNLIDALAWGKNGYFIRYQLLRLLYIYVRRNGLRDPNAVEYIIPDAYFQEYFGKNRAATFYVYRNPNGNIEQILMGDAVNAGLIDRPLNTFEVIQRLNPDFNPGRFTFYYLDDIVTINELSPQYLASHLNFPGYQEIYANITSANVRQNLHQEGEIIKRAYNL